MRRAFSLPAQGLLFLALCALLPGLKGTTLLGISAYQRFISPALGPQCGYARIRHAETCSAYAKRSIAERGLFQGTSLALLRFSACKHLARELKP